MSVAAPEVDAVIAWVDGADPAHRAKLDAALARHGIRRPPGATPTRFNDAGEIDFCLASIMRHAPWIRRVHIVTDNQVPAVMQRIARGPWAGRVQVVDHRSIFGGFEQYLPTFNSRAICSLLWRIPGLAPHYVYFNDDMALLRPVDAGDFFRDGKVVTRGAWRPQSHATLAGRVARWWKRRGGQGIAPDSERAAQELSAQLAGFGDRYYRIEHVPYPFRKATLGDFFARHPEVLQRDLAWPFRRAGQFRAECLAAHLEIAAGRALLDNRLRVVQLKPRQQAPWRLRRKLAHADHDTRAAFACVQSLELAPSQVQADIEAWLRRHVGAPA